MKRQFSVLLVALIVVSLAAGSYIYFSETAQEQEQLNISAHFVSSSLDQEENPDVSQQQVSELVEGNNKFAFDLYQQIKDGKNNIFYSPYSISTALAMTYAGARGRTGLQIADTLYFTLPQEKLHPTFNALAQGFEGRENFVLKLANALWGQENWRFKEDFLDTLALNYGAGMHRLDFEEKPEQARRIVNGWVENHTENKIENLIPRGAFKGLPTVLVLTNAIYFQAPWASSFSEDLTQEKSFTLLNGENVEVPMMSSGSRPFLCTEGKNYKAVKIHYLGNASMTVILPDEGCFREVERDLDTEFVEGVSENLKSRTVVLEMPKFSFESKFDLSDALKEMGMPKAFTDEANFSGMTPDTPVWIDQVLHQAYISVDEKGTEAAAATSVEMVAGIGSNIKLNRPFIFLIRDDETGAILFAGRVLNPAA